MGNCAEVEILYYREGHSDIVCGLQYSMSLRDEQGKKVSDII